MTEMVSTEELIAVIYTNWTAETGKRWMRIELLAARADRDDLNETIAGLMADDGFRVEQEPFGHRLSAWEREHCPVIGGEQVHLIAWE